jgi:glucose-6-phosphate 1-dehydrogenase
MVARVVPVEPFDLVVFGATGDLAKRKLIPALYQRLRAGQAPDGARFIGAARTDLGPEGFRALAEEALREFVPADELDRATVDRFLGALDYVTVDAGDEGGWRELAAHLPEAGGRPRAFYLSVAPKLFGPIAQRIAAAKLGGDGARIVVEKPLGRDLSSAQALNRQLAEAFDESQIYRIDHYLGKETVQNLMALRFANALFEPLWNARHVDHVQITVAESVGVAGRGAYYDGVGAMRDMIQNHLLQLLCLTAMEPPARFSPDMVRDEKLKVLRALGAVDPRTDTVRGQYRGNGGPSYLEDAGDPASRTESYVAVKAHVENWRWSGVPFYLRTGKRLRARMSEIAIIFKDAPHSIFPQDDGSERPNVLAIRLQPDEGITLGMTIKDPGPGGMRLTGAELDMTFADKLGPQLRMPDAYERLVMDVIRGDQTLFMRGDEVEAAWAWIDPIVTAWEDGGDRPKPYDAGSSGPEDALMLMHRDGRRWREIAV